MTDESAKVVARHHKDAVDAATKDVQLAANAIVEKNYRHARGLLKLAAEHLETAEVIQRILRELPREK